MRHRIFSTIMILFLLFSVSLYTPLPAKSDVIQQNLLIQKVTIDNQQDSYPLNSTITFNTIFLDIHDNLEFQLWEKYNNGDWKVVKPFSAWPLNDYMFTNSGTANLQVDVRQKSDPFVVQQFWLGQFQIKQSTNQLIKSITMNPSNMTYSINDKVNFIIDPYNDINSLEFQLWEKYSDKDWTIAVPYSSWPLPAYSFKSGGVANLQIDVRNKLNHANIQQFWLGQFNVQQTVKLVNAISWSPFKVVFDIGDQLRFNVIQNVIDINSLEFQVWEKYNNEDWTVAVPYTMMPLPNYNFRKSGIANLQIDLRDKNNKSYTQKKWLGQFYVNKANGNANSDNLLRQILSNYNPVLINDMNTVYKPIAEELNLAINMMYWQYRSLNIESQKAGIEGLTGITVLNEVSPGVINCSVDGQGTINKIDLNNRSVSSSYVTINVNIQQHPNIQKVFESMNDSPENLTKLVAFNYLVYNTYNYSQVPFQDVRPITPLFSTIGNCDHYADALFHLLASLNYTVQKIGIDRGTYGAHELCRIKLEDNFYLLDPTADVIYNGDITDIAKNYMVPIILPQIRDLPDLWSNEAWSQFLSWDIDITNGNW